ncbi:MAG: T9SS type A sorting domain-containing protein [Lewinella sp.]|nr:T9SS type A sorting domain-containing protein [Lewinella sp.]
MTLKHIYPFLMLAGLGLLFINSSSGPGNVQGIDRTNGPLSTGYCGNCHGAGSFNPSISLELLDGEDPVGIWTPGQTYTVRVTIAADDGAQRYGFQAVALDGNNDQIGSFTAGTGTHVVTLNGREYIEHSSPNISNTFEVSWTAPNDDAEDVFFYAAGIAANNSGSSGGDGAAFLAEAVSVAGPLNARDLPALAEDLRVFPNPVGEAANIQLELSEATTAQLRLFNVQGQLLRQQTESLNAGLNQLRLHVDDLPHGQYWLELSDGRRLSRTALIKQ